MKVIKMNANNKKEIVGFTAFAVIVVIIIIACKQNTPEKRTLKFFNTHREELEEEVLNIKKGDMPAGSSFVDVNYWDGEHPIVEYTVVIWGIVPSTRYYGVFYSFDDTPAAFENADVSVIPVSINEWEWHGDGDNNGIVRKLDDNWFYFEAYF